MNIRRDVLSTIVAHALTERPNECCGLLLGTGETVDEAIPARNERRSPTRFLIQSEDHLKALRLARSTGRHIIAAYHSHPKGPSNPSETDRAEMNDPGLLHVIISLARAEPDVRVYGWQDGDFRAVEMRVLV